MSITAIDSWRLAGCGPDCRPRRHDPADHEAYGRRTAFAERGPTRVRTGLLLIDTDRKLVAVGGRPLDGVPPRPWALLAALAASAGRVVPWERLADEVLGYPLDPSAQHNLRQLAGRTRGLLGAAASCIETVPYAGLRLRLEGDA